MDKKSYMKKLLSVLMAVAVAVTFVPFLGDSAFAGEPQDPEVPEIEVVLDDADDLVEGIEVEDEENTALNQDEVTTESESPVATEPVEDDSLDADAIEGEEDTQVDGGSLGGGSARHLDILLDSEGGKMSTKSGSLRGDGVLGIASSYYKVDIIQSGNTVSVKGTLNTRFYFDGLYVNGTRDQAITGNSVDTTINMNNYATGYYTVYLGIRKKGKGNYKDLGGNTVSAEDTAQVDIIGNKYVSSNTITSRPNYGGRFTVYSNYLNIAPFSLGGGNYDMMSLYNQPKLYLEYSPNNGRSWQRSGYMQYNAVTTITNQVYKIGGLAPNTTYLTRLRYGVNTYYDEYYGGDGKYYMFYGPVLNTTTIKTGKATKPKIKKVTAKAVNVKYHKKYRPGYYYWTGYHYVWIKGTKMRYYTYNVKVTVKLKKKPGTAGIFVNGRFLKGNKKKYTTKFKIPSPHNMSVKKPKGHIKYKVTIQSGQSASYGGYSPAWSKKKKLK